MGKSLVYAYQNGELTSVTDREQKTTSFSYLAGHYLQDIVDARGITPIRNEYDADGRLTKHVDAFGKEIDYQHRVDQREEVVTDRLGHSRLVAYDARGNVVREVDALGHQATRVFDGDDLLLSETDALNHTPAHTYDAGHDLPRAAIRWGTRRCPSQLPHLDRRPRPHDDVRVRRSWIPDAASRCRGARDEVHLR